MHGVKFPSFYGPRRFITAFTNALQPRWASATSFGVRFSTSWVVQNDQIPKPSATLHTSYIHYGEEHLPQPPSWRTTPCRLSEIAYSIYSQLPSILEAVHPSATWGPAMPWWHGPTYHRNYYNLINKLIINYDIAFKATCGYLINLPVIRYIHKKSVVPCTNKEIEQRGAAYPRSSSASLSPLPFM